MRRDAQALGDTINGDSIMCLLRTMEPSDTDPDYEQEVTPKAGSGGGVGSGAQPATARGSRAAGPQASIAPCAPGRGVGTCPVHA